MILKIDINIASEVDLNNILIELNWLLLFFRYMFRNRKFSSNIYQLRCMYELTFNRITFTFQSYNLLLLLYIKLKRFTSFKKKKKKTFFICTFSNIKQFRNTWEFFLIHLYFGTNSSTFVTGNFYLIFQIDICNNSNKKKKKFMTGIYFTSKIYDVFLNLNCRT